MVTTTKSTSVTNADATPVVANTEGEGAKTRLKQVNDYATAIVSDGQAANLQIIKLVRIASTAKVKAVRAEAAALSKGSFDVGLYYSASTVDGTPAAKVGTPLSTAFFASALDFSSAYAKTDCTNENTPTNYPVSARNLPIWQAVGLASDPGGNFDVALTQTAITVVVAGLVGVEVDFA